MVCGLGMRGPGHNAAAITATCNAPNDARGRLMTDIQAFIEAEGRAEQVAEVQKRIEAEGIQYLYC